MDSEGGTGQIWEAARWSLLGTIWPVLFFAVGVAFAGGGFTGLVSLWGGPPRWQYAIVLAFGIFAMAFEYLQFNFMARQVTMFDDGSFRFVARRRAWEIAAGEIMGLEGWSPLTDPWEMLPLRLRTSNGSVWVERRVGGLGDLLTALRSANPGMYFRPPRLVNAQR